MVVTTRGREWASSHQISHVRLRKQSKGLLVAGIACPFRVIACGVVYLKIPELIQPTAISNVFEFNYK